MASKESGKGADSAPNIRPGKGTDPAQNAATAGQAGASMAPAPRGGWFGGKK